MSKDLEVKVVIHVTYFLILQKILQKYRKVKEMEKRVL